MDVNYVHDQGGLIKRKQCNEGKRYNKKLKCIKKGDGELSQDKAEKHDPT